MRALFRAVNSAVECHLHTVEATGSNPVPPTKTTEWQRRLQRIRLDRIVRIFAHASGLTRDTKCIGCDWRADCFKYCHRAQDNCRDGRSMLREKVARSLDQSDSQSGHRYQQHPARYACTKWLLE